MRADFWGQLFGVEEPADDYELRGKVAIVRIEGPLTHHAEWFWDSYDAIKSRAVAALQSAAEVLVLKIGSPGGDVAGCFETVRELRTIAAKAGKRIVAYADGMAASAGYALACAGDAIFLPATGFVGSIGVISMLFDMTELDKKIGLNFAVIASGQKKRYGHPNVRISDAAIENSQSQVDALSELFFELVAEARGIPTSSIAALEAGMLLGADAVSAKLADRVCTFDEMLESLSSGNTTAPGGAAAEASMGWKDEMKKAADEGDEEAKKCLAELDEEEAPKSKKEDAAEPKEGESAEDPKEPKEGAEDPKEDDKAAARARGPVRIAATPLESRVLAIETERERDRLLASRPDLMRDPAIRKKLASAPIDTVRWNVENLPKVAAAPKAPEATTQTKPTAHAAATVPGVTRADGEGGSPLGVTRKSSRADELDQKLGFASSKQAVVHERNETAIRVMTPAEARAHRKTMEALTAQQNGGK